MKKTYIAPTLHICVISESAMLCTSAPKIVDNGNATNDRTGGDGETDSYVKAHSIWDKEW